MSEVNQAVPEFDWDTYENGVVDTRMSQEELINMYDKTLSTIVEKEVNHGYNYFK